jgi:hypothetical protein
MMNHFLKNTNDKQQRNSKTKEEIFPTSAPLDRIRPLSRENSTLVARNREGKNQKSLGNPRRESDHIQSAL